jgi:multidrug efflux system membrane fusion protein
VQTETGTVKLRATLPNQDYYFWPGQFVNVRLVLEVKKNAVLVPQTAIQIGQQGPFVYVVENGMAQMRPVVAGQPQSDLVHIQSGLTGGEKVITAGQLMVQPGAPVVIAPPAAPAANGARGTPSTQPTTAPTTSPSQD